MYKIRHIKSHKPFGLFSFVNLVISSIIGADIYIIISKTADLSGPTSIFAWILCGVIAITISQCFAQCAHLISESGGTFIYVEKAFGRFWGFLSGWILYLSEWVCLIIYPLAFVTYLHYFIPASNLIDSIIKTLFIAIFTLINLKGARMTSQTNNILTFIKTLPLIILIVISIVWAIGNTSSAVHNISYIKPHAMMGFGQVVLLAFWAYAGFESSVLPSDEVDNPKKTIPRGIIIGNLFIMLFYVMVNVSVFLVLPTLTIVQSQFPLATTVNTIFPNTHLGIIIVLGALFSISGITLALMFELSHLLQKMAKDGFLFKFLAQEKGKDKIPVHAIIMQSVIALIISFVADISSVISFSVILLAIIYILTALSNWKLHTKVGKTKLQYRIISITTIIFSIFLLLQGNITQYVLSVVVIVIGILWYIMKGFRDKSLDAKTSLLK
jgi:APA family basic amino acid/polyamine antiporter